MVGDVYPRAQKLLSSLRNEGVTVAVDNTGKKLASTIKNASKKNIRYALFIGEKELEEERYNLKDLQTSTEETLSPERIISKVLDSRNN